MNLNNLKISTRFLLFVGFLSIGIAFFGGWSLKTLKEVADVEDSMVDPQAVQFIPARAPDSNLSNAFGTGPKAGNKLKNVWMLPSIIAVWCCYEP